MAFPTRAEYEQLVYALPDQSAEVVSSSLRLFTRSRDTAVMRGSVHFVSGLELRVFEVLDFAAATISDYSYTVIYAGERVRWYDPQPHPEVPELQTNFPHHRHEPPDIKHNRRPAPGISFATPNLAILIDDCIELGAALAAEEVT